MPTAERAKRERERAVLREVGEEMRERISHAGMVPLDQERRFQFQFLARGRWGAPWAACGDCGAPMVELPEPSARFGYLPRWFCYLCHFDEFAAAVEAAAALAPKIAASRRQDPL